MLAVASALPQLVQGTAWTPGRGDHRRWDARPGMFLEVAPGMLRVYKTSEHLKDKAFDSAFAEKMRNTSTRKIRAAYRGPMALLTDGELELLGAPKKQRPATNRRITAWTRRSRSRMQDQIARLDFTPLFEAGLEPAMVTLTMPGLDETGRDVWGDYAPTPAAFKKIVDRFTLRYQQAWGARLQAVWKLEFQERGAPHLHILMTPPAGVVSTRHGDVEFREWLSVVWAACVGSTGVARINHERAGTGIDYVGDEYRDPRRIGTYFGKHGFYAAKGYQNELPELWADAIKDGATGARYWGVWGLQKASAVVMLDEAGSASIATILDPLGVVRAAVGQIKHYRPCLDLVEESAAYSAGATDATVMRMMQRARDGLGSQSSDAVRVQRHLRKLSKASAMRGRQLVRNEHGQLVLPRDSTAIRRIRFEAPDMATGEIRVHRRYRIGYYQGGSGRVYVNDGRTAGLDLLRILGDRTEWLAAA